MTDCLFILLNIVAPCFTFSRATIFSSKKVTYFSTMGVSLKHGRIRLFFIPMLRIVEVIMIHWMYAKSVAELSSVVYVIYNYYYSLPKRCSRRCSFIIARISPVFVKWNNSFPTVVLFSDLFSSPKILLGCPSSESSWYSHDDWWRRGRLEDCYDR